MMLPLLELQNVAIQAGGVVLARGISLEVQTGELVAVTGPSGVGKTTLLRTICGLQDASAGAVRLHGRTGEDWGWPVFRRQVLLVSQKPILLDGTVRENLMRPWTYQAAASGRFDAVRAGEWLMELGVGIERLDQRAQTLSVGQQQRVALVRGLLLDPAVLCLDEPTSALDPESTERVEELIGRLAAERGLAALIVTHNPMQAQNWCGRRLGLVPAALPERGTRE